MSLDRKDLRLKLDPDDHSRLSLCADMAGLELSALAEQILVAEVRRRIHEAIVMAQRAQRLGIAGNEREY